MDNISLIFSIRKINDFFFYNQNILIIEPWRADNNFN